MGSYQTEIYRQIDLSEPITPLLRISRDIFLPTILGTVEGIKALTTYLEQSGAFTIHGRPVSERETPQFDDELDPPESDDETGP